MPVLLVMNVIHAFGLRKAFLHDPSCCAFPEEKEYLLGSSFWHVTAVSEETLEYKGESFEGWVIRFE